MIKLFSLTCCLFATIAFSQNYTSYRTGSSTNATANANGGVCLMGGATEQDDAMIWFLQRAGGGDVLVLRTSGSDGYNDYFYSTLGVALNSVETIVCHSAAASNEIYVQDRIKEAEAIWFAGGDQWEYITFWRDTPVDSLINKGILERNVAIGGTSAGMAIQGAYYFSAENGTITSNTALSDPFSNNLTVSNLPFLQNDHLEQVVTDTHYDNPDRKGRHVAFLARILNDDQLSAKGIACDEYTAVCIDPNGIAHVYGDPTYDDIAYFIQGNCEINSNSPEVISPSTPLTWNQNNSAIKAYVIHGTLDGTRTFDLNDWYTGTGGTWENWWVENGTLTTSASNAPDCSLAINDNAYDFNYYPNPAHDIITFNSMNGEKRLIDALGICVSFTTNETMNIDYLPNGFYVLVWINGEEVKHFTLQIHH